MRLARCVVEEGSPLRRAAERFQVSPDSGGGWSQLIELVRRGAMLAVDQCDGWNWDVELTDDVMCNVVTAAESHRRARGKYSGETIMAASAWEKDAGDRRLVVLSEENAKRRSVLAESVG
ncbi:MAG: hypothetical protein ACJ72N_13275 [Labedaea sp.]